MFVPQNEQGVVVLFTMMSRDAGWEIVEIGSGFPDAILKQGDETWRVEFEFNAACFAKHGHDHRGCDMIICWDNDYEECPMPIVALNEPDSLLERYTKADVAQKETEYWRCRALRAERQVRSFGGYVASDNRPAYVEPDNSRLAYAAAALLAEDSAALCGFYDENGTMSRERVMAVRLMTKRRWENARRNLETLEIVDAGGAMIIGPEAAMAKLGINGE